MHFHGDPFHFCLFSQPYKSLASVSTVPCSPPFRLSMVLATNPPQLKVYVFSCWFIQVYAVPTYTRIERL